MEFKKVQKVFKVMAMKGSGEFENFGTEVPKMAQLFLTRKNEIQNVTSIEVALFEPKRDVNHEKGFYYVGLLLSETPEVVPSRMEFLEESREYVTVRGNMREVGKLHQHLSQWSEENGHIKDSESLIVETYHPLPNGEEEIEIYLPLK